MANPMLFGKRCAPAVAEDESNTEVKYTGLDTRMSETVSRCKEEAKRELTCEKAVDDNGHRKGISVQILTIEHREPGTYERLCCHTQGEVAQENAWQCLASEKAKRNNRILCVPAFECNEKTQEGPK